MKKKERNGRIWQLMLVRLGPHFFQFSVSYLSSWTSSLPSVFTMRTVWHCGSIIHTCDGPKMHTPDKRRIGDVARGVMGMKWGHVFVWVHAIANVFSVLLPYADNCSLSASTSLQSYSKPSAPNFDKNNFDIGFIISRLELHHGAMLYLRHLRFVKDKID